MSQPASSNRIHLVTHLYLLWIDNGDLDMPVDSQVRRQYTELARKHPSCPVDEEAMQWIRVNLPYMSEMEIEQAVADAVSMRAWPAPWLTAHRDNLADLLAYKRSLGPTRTEGQGSITITFK